MQILFMAEGFYSLISEHKTSALKQFLITENTLLKYTWTQGPLATPPSSLPTAYKSPLGFTHFLLHSSHS